MTSETPSAQPLPLFYCDPQPLSAALHGGWSVRDGDLTFAEETPFVPVVVGEFAQVMRSYPIVFAAGAATPLAVLGLEQANLFVEDGRWDERAYVPAYVRRYPFGFIATSNPDGFVLAIDTLSRQVDQTGAEGVPLFTEDKPSQLTRQALAFCDAFRSEATATAEFGAALQAKELLIDRRADATLPDGRKLGVEGFQIIDAEKFAQLDAGTLVEWHHKGFLALAHFHLASLDRFNDLLTRQAARHGPVPELATTDAAKTDEPAKGEPADVTN